MNRTTLLPEKAGVVLVLAVTLGSVFTAPGATNEPVKKDAPEAAPAATTPAVDPLADPAASSSVEQGHTELADSFEQSFREWRLEKRHEAFADTEFKFNLRTMYLTRDKYDSTHMESAAIGGWAGLKTGYFMDHISIGLTGYTSQHLSGEVDEDGAGMLEPGQEGYTVLGEAYADIRIKDNMNLYIGRKEYDTPYINKNDVRMTPNTFEAITLIGKQKLGEDGATVKYGLGYFSRIKERNSVDFVPMSEDAGADVDRGVFTAGGIYQKDKFSFGLIDYYSPDIINIAYAEAKWEFQAGNLKPRIALQFSDQRGVDGELLKGMDFKSDQFGAKIEVPVGQALFTVGYTSATGDSNMQNPWSGYPGYTSVQVEDFNRAGEDAWIFRAGYDVKQVKGLSAYALWVHGSDPEAADQYARDEVNLNLQWMPPEGGWKGFSIRARYSVVDQHGGDSDNLEDFRLICNYAKSF